MMTGTTPNGGGMYKQLLHGMEQGLLRRNIPVMVQALHFLNYGAILPKQLEMWLSKPLRKHYNGNFDLDYHAHILADSGGYVFMQGPPAGLDRYGFFEHNMQEKILELQLALGASRIVSLDYPIPPGLTEEESRNRLNKTLQNALYCARILSERPDKDINLVVPVHGNTPEQAAIFTQEVLERLDKENLMQIVHGVGLGSIVPLRKAGRQQEIVRYVRAVRGAAGELPMHVFGVTGLLVPFLLHAGATTFDTSGYIQKARSLKYITPNYKERRLWELLSYPCTCQVCYSRDVHEDVFVMRAKKGEVKRGRKSVVYAATALHNLEMDMQILDKAIAAREKGVLEDYLVELARPRAQLRALLEGEPLPEAVEVKPVRNDPTAFDIRKRRFKAKKPICLILTCSQAKPYTDSSSYKRVVKSLQGLENDIDIVFLSGLYGPVPLRYVKEPAVLNYDFLLSKRDKTAQARVYERLMYFIEKYKHDYSNMIGFVANPAYRGLLQKAGVTLLPEQSQSRFSLLKNENQEALRHALSLAADEIADSAAMNIDY